MLTPGPSLGWTVPPGPTCSCDPNGCWYMSLNAQLPAVNSAATTASVVTAASGTLRATRASGTRVSSQAPSSAMAPSAGT